MPVWAYPLIGLAIAGLGAFVVTLYFYVFRIINPGE